MLPTAVDKAILLWLNYKNTYEFWNEQREQIRKLPSRQLLQPFDRERGQSARRNTVFEQFANVNFPSTGPLFLQVKVEGMNCFFRGWGEERRGKTKKQVNENIEIF